MFREEIFGPVAPITTFRTDDEALAAGQRHRVRPGRLRVHPGPGRAPSGRGAASRPAWSASTRASSPTRRRRSAASRPVGLRSRGRRRGHRGVPRDQVRRSGPVTAGTDAAGRASGQLRRVRWSCWAAPARSAPRPSTSSSATRTGSGSRPWRPGERTRSCWPGRPCGSACRQVGVADEGAAAAVRAALTRRRAPRPARPAALPEVLAGPDAAVTAGRVARRTSSSTA